MNFQKMILTLQQFWAEQNCIIVQPYDVEKGAGTMNPMTFLRSIGPEPWNVAYVEPSRRPADGRYGENPNRLVSASSISGYHEAFAGQYSGTVPGKLKAVSASIRCSMIFVL